MTVADWPLESRIFWNLLRSGVTSRTDAELLPNEAAEQVEREHPGLDPAFYDYLRR